MKPDYLASVAQAANVLHELAFDKHLLHQVSIAGTQIMCTADAGRIITTGMGKAGHIARKFSATLSSMGIPSHYVHPGEAHHGDLGQMHNSDLIFILSTSGKTAEVLMLLDHIAQNPSTVATRTIGITSHKTCLPTMLHVEMPLMQEADEFDLVPTTSTTVMLAICDAIALDAAKKTGFTKEVFANRHHGGYLGQKARQQ